MSFYYCSFTSIDNWKNNQHKILRFYPEGVRLQFGVSRLAAPPTRKKAKLNSLLVILELPTGFDSKEMARHKVRGNV